MTVLFLTLPKLYTLSQNPLPYFWRGLAYFAKGDDARAIEDFTDALKRDPDDVTVYFCRSMAYLRAEDSRCYAVNDRSKAGISSTER